MTVLQPITSKSPSSADVLEQSGLPFGFVLRPFGNRSSLSSGNDDEFYARQLERQRRNPPISDDSKGEGDKLNLQKLSSQNQNHIQNYPLKLALVAKCTHCGSPMNPSSPIVGRWTVLCNLCGKTYDIDYQTQHESRMAASASSSVTSFPSISMQSNTHTKNKTVSMPLDSSGMDETEYRNRFSTTSTLTECVKPLMEYSLPLLSMAPPSPTPNSRRIEDSTDMEVAESIYTMPAKLCPPLLAIFIDATCPNPQYYNRICETLNQLINLKDSSENESKSKSGEHAKDGYGLCKSTRIGIFCMTENGGLSIFDLTENGGHLKHVWVRKPDVDTVSSSERDYQSGGDDYDNEEFEVAPLADIMTPEEIFAPLDSEYSKSCVLSALRGLADSSITIDMACQRSHNSKKKLTSRTKVSSGHEHGGGICFGSTLEYFLDFMKHVGYHPGEMNQSNHMLNENIDSDTRTGSCDLEPAQKFMYAGGKIMCFLSGPPDEIGIPTIRKSLKAESQAELNGRIGAGGYGGSCAELGKRFEGMKDGGSGGRSYLSGNDEPADIDVDVEFGKGLPRKDMSGKGSAEKPTDTRSSHQDKKIAKTKYLNVTDLYEDIGKHSARSAFSMEIFALLPKLENEESDKEHLPEQYVGIPFLKLLSDRSGGAGPLVLTYPLGPSISDNEDDILANEVISRSSLNRNHAFGSMLRVRLPPSLRIDTNTTRSKASRSNEMSVNSEHNFDKYYQTNGLYGSITASNEDSALFYIGSCDESSTLSFALNICSRSGRLDEYVYVDGRGDVRLCPCIQTCFAYTSIVKNRGQWVTVRRLRVLTLELDLTTSVESMTASLDSEALIVSLYHNFYHHALQYGLISVEDHAVNWLLSVLFCCYESARKMQGLIDRYGPTVEGASVYYPSDRLLDTEGSHFSNRDILLGRGHVVFEFLPLLVFALVQSDTLRPNCGGFKPSIDARAAAAAHMGNMPPLTISRCIAPRLELWLTGEDSSKAVNEDVSMSMNDVRYAIIDYIGTSDGEEGEDYKGPMPLLLLDSPSQVLIHDCRELCNLRKTTDEDIPPAMINSAEDGRRSYRVAPQFNKLVSGVEDCACAVAMQRISDAMVEDSVTSIKRETFNEWCTAIAEVLHSELSTTT